jgi:hypothetical protein
MNENKMARPDRFQQGLNTLLAASLRKQADAPTNAVEPAIGNNTASNTLQNKPNNVSRAGYGEFGQQMLSAVTSIDGGFGTGAVSRASDDADRPGTFDTRDAFSGRPGMPSARPDYSRSEQNVSEKFKLKKEASELMAKCAELQNQGNAIVQLLLESAMQEKTAAAQGTFTAEQIANDARSIAGATVDREQVKTALKELADNAIYAAETTALYLKEAEDELPDEEEANAAIQRSIAANEEGGDDELPPEILQELSTLNDAMDAELSEAVQSGELTPEEAELEKEEIIGEIIDELQSGGEQDEALEGMDEEIDQLQAAVESELAEQVQSGELTPEEAELEKEEVLSEIAAELESGVIDDEIGGEERLDELFDAYGATDDEKSDVLNTIVAENEAGIPPEQIAAAEDETQKTGHYKFASFIGRPALKTADEERRASKIRCAVRDHVRGARREDLFV